MTEAAQETVNTSGKRKGKSGTPTRRFHWLRIGLLNVVFLVTPFGAWYFMHVQGQLENNTIRLFRALSEVDATLVQNVNNLPNIAVFSRQVTRDCQADPDPVSIGPGQLAYEEVIRLNPALQNIAFDFKQLGQGPDSELVTGIQQDGNAYVATVTCTSRPAAASPLLAQSKGEANTGTPTAAPDLPEPLISTSIDDLLGEVVAGAAARFDHVMLTDRSGTIVSRAGTRVLKDARQTGAITTDPFRYDYFNYANLAPMLESAKGCRREEELLVESETTSAAPQHAHSVTCGITVGRTAFTLFIHPSALAVPLDGQSTAWYVVGVVRDSELRSQSLVAPLSISGPVLVLILIALAGLPLLWLSTKSRRSLLSTTHFAFTLGGGIIILALSTILALHLLYSRDVTLQMDLSLKELSGRMRTAFDSELAERLDRLSGTWERQGCNLHAPWGAEAFPPYEVRLVLGSTPAYSDPPARPAMQGVTVTQPANYRHYSPTFANLSSRDYYQQPMRGRAWLREGQPFYIERIRSYVDGVKDSVLTIPVAAENVSCELPGDNNARPGNRAEVVMEILPFRSLTHAVIPPHHGYAVVENASGRVLYHSSDIRSLEENFIDETDGDQLLISMLQSRTGGYLELDYHGRGVRAFADPMQHVPWTLVTFMDDEIIDTVLLEALITAAALVICYAFAVMLAFWVYARVIDRSSAHRSLQWLWPNPEHARQYPALMLSVLVMGALFMTLSIRDTLSDSVIHQLFFLTPLLALLMARFVFNPDLHDFSHRTGALLIVVVMAVFFVFNNSQPGAWLWGITVLVVLLLFGLLVHLTRRREPSAKPAAWGHLRSLLPLVAALIYTGPVAGLILYLPVIESFAQSYSHYADDQVLRALDLGEEEYRRVTRRYHDKDRPDAHPPQARYTRLTGEDPYACRGTFLQRGPFLGAPDGQEWQDSGEARPKRLVYQEHCRWVQPDAAAVQACQDEPPSRVLNDNWTAWFVFGLPAFSYESGALKQAARQQRDNGRLRWCAGAEPDSPRQFLGRSQLNPDFILMKDASDLSFAYMSRQDVDPGLKLVEADWMRTSVISAVLFFAMLIGTFLYAIARAIAHHLFGAHLPAVEFDTIDLRYLERSASRDLVLISPVTMLEQAHAVFPGARVFNPHSWREFIVESGKVPGQHTPFSAQDVLIVDEVETAFYVAEQRSVLLSVLEEAFSVGARVIMLARVDPVHWLDTLDARSLAEAEELPISQDEVIVWSSLMRKFSVALVSKDDAWSGLSQAQAHHEHMRNWAVSTRHERNVLANLALSDLYNPRNSDEIFHLVRRGLVSPRPPYELANPGFKTFILRSPELEPLKGWRKEGGGSLWTALWPTLLVIIGLLMFFVVSSGQNTVKTAAALLASVVAALPVLMSVFAFARNNSKG